MAMDHGDVITLSVNSGGEGSGTGALQVFDMPDAPALAKGRVKKIVISNLTGVAGYVFLADEDGDATALPASSKVIHVLSKGDTILYEDDLDWDILIGINAAASNAATSDGYRIQAWVDIRA